MTEEEAQAWIGQHFGAEATERLSFYARLVVEENEKQNLIAPSTIATFWSRHLLDAAQLVPLAATTGVWLDIGSGAGLPGMVAAILRPERTVLVEPRRQRAEHLRRCASLLGLGNVEIRQERVEMTRVTASIISARAVGSVEKLLQVAGDCGSKATRWLLPRGKFGNADMDALRQRWGGLFHMKQSLTNAESTILICDGPYRR